MMHHELWSEAIELLAERREDVYALRMARQIVKLIERQFRDTYGGETMSDPQLMRLSGILHRLQEYISVEEGNGPDQDRLEMIADLRKEELVFDQLDLAQRETEFELTQGQRLT